MGMIQKREILSKVVILLFRKTAHECFSVVLHAVGVWELDFAERVPAWR